VRSPRPDDCGFGISFAEAVLGGTKTGKSPPPSVAAVSLDLSASIAAVGCSDGNVMLWKVVDDSLEQCIGFWRAHDEAVRSVALGGSQVVTGGRGGQLRLWNALNGSIVFPMEGHEGDVLALDVDFDRQRACSGASDSSLKVWDLTDGSLLCSLNGCHDAQLTGVQISFGDRPWRIASCCVDSVFTIWELDEKVPGVFVHEAIVIHGANAAVFCLAVDFSQRKALLGCRDGSIIYRTWQPKDSSTKAVSPDDSVTHAVEASTITVDALSEATGEIMGQSDRGLHAEPNSSGDIISELGGHQDCVRAISANFDLDLAVSASYDWMLIVWDLSTQSCQAILRGHTAWVLSVAVDWEAKRIVSGGADGMLRVWDLENGIPKDYVYALTGILTAHEVVTD